MCHHWFDLSTGARNNGSTENCRKCYGFKCENRSGTSYPKTSSLPEGEIVFITEIHNNWCKIALEDK